MNDKDITKYSVHSKGVFIKHMKHYVPDTDDAVYPLVKYTYENVEYVEEPIWKSASRNWLYSKNGDEVDIYINPSKPKKFIAVVPNLSPEELRIEKRRTTIYLLIALFCTFVMALIFITLAVNGF